MTKDQEYKKEKSERETTKKNEEREVEGKTYSLHQGIMKERQNR